MFIKFSDLDMLDFFGQEPISIGEQEEAKFIYSLNDESMLSMILTVNTYEKTIEVSIYYQNDIIFAGQFEDILEIKKSGDALLVEMEGKRRLLLKKNSCLGVIMESE